MPEQVAFNFPTLIVRASAKKRIRTILKRKSVQASKSDILETIKL